MIQCMSKIIATEIFIESHTAKLLNKSIQLIFFLSKNKKFYGP